MGTAGLQFRDIFALPERGPVLAYLAGSSLKDRVRTQRGITELSFWLRG